MSIPIRRACHADVRWPSPRSDGHCSVAAARQQHLRSTTHRCALHYARLRRGRRNLFRLWAMVTPMTHGHDGASAELTPREKEVLALLAQGKSTRQVAAILGITKRTVDAHVQSAMTKIGAVNRAQAIAIAIDVGLIKLD